MRYFKINISLDWEEAGVERRDGVRSRPRLLADGCCLKQRVIEQDDLAQSEQYSRLRGRSTLDHHEAEEDQLHLAGSGGPPDGRRRAEGHGPVRGGRGARLGESLA